DAKERKNEEIPMPARKRQLFQSRDKFCRFRLSDNHSSLPLKSICLSRSTFLRILHLGFPAKAIDASEVSSAAPGAIGRSRRDSLVGCKCSVGLRQIHCGANDPRGGTTSDE